ncbi:hypothetical protein Efla_001180 [Eimeria flavescens]
MTSFGNTENYGPSQFSRFKWSFLFVYFLAQFCEYLQGPYMYSLHLVHYSLPLEKVGLLFFISSLSNSLVGCVVGALTDTHEKSWGCVAFCVLSIASCAISSASASYCSLSLARVLGGTATSLLETAFESYVVCEHHNRGYPHAALNDIFACASGGSGLAAVLAGLAAAAAVSRHGLTAPFIWGAVVGFACLFSIFFLWIRTGSRNANPQAPEVAEEPAAGPSPSLQDEDRRRAPQGFVRCFSSASEAAQKALLLFAQRRDARVCGFLQAGFEVPLDLFVFLWSEDVPYGLTQGLAFAMLMVGLSAGSYLFSLVSSPWQMPAGNLTRNFGLDLYRTISTSFFCGSLALLWSITATGFNLKFVAYLAFEVVIGVLYPALSSLRAAVLPDAYRASATNLPRVVFNLLLLGILSSEALQHPAGIFAASAVGMAVAGSYAEYFRNTAACRSKLRHASLEI